LLESGFIFGTVGTPQSTPKKPGGSVGTLQFLSSLGLHALELGWVRAVRVSEETCARIKSAAKEANIRLSIHAPYYINLNASEEEWPKSLKRLMDAAHYGHLAGATDIIFHPGSYFGQQAKTILKVAIPRLQGCVDKLRTAGNPVTLRPETMGKRALLGSLEDTLEMSREIEGVEPCIDFAHMHARQGDGSLNSFDEWMEVLASYQKALGNGSLKHMHCHLSGIDYGPKGERKHLLLADSDLDLLGLLRALAKSGCAGRILCESPKDMDNDALYIKANWHSIMLGEM
jgi:deoxyribonuclease-4